MTRKNCVYCNKEITTPSREHVIQNALGGLYESTDICCPECNNYVSREIDKPFTAIFSPILCNFGPMVKTANKDSTPIYTGTISYNDKDYDAIFRGRKLSSCPDLSRELKCDISKLPFTVKSYNFDLQNDAFRTGMSKIAFNYALSQGVNFRFLKPGIKIDRTGGNVNSIKFEYPVIPFRPLNALDAYMEFGTEYDPYHHMVLFSQGANLWCYIDLFNTFQYYVMLSETLPRGMHYQTDYLQTLKKNDIDAINIPPIEIFSPKDASIYAQQYGVEPCMDAAEMERRIRNKLVSKPHTQSPQKYLSQKIPSMWAMATVLNTPREEDRRHLWQSTMLYFDDNDLLQTDKFRTVTPNADGTAIVSYPEQLCVMKNIPATRAYHTLKFARMNDFLLHREK